MAINAVEYIAPKDKVTKTRSHTGGGKFGQVAGAAIGGVAGSGGGPAGAIAGAAAGASLGGMLGEIIDPSKHGTTAIQRKIGAAGPQVIHSTQSEQLKSSLLALQQQPPAIQQEYKAPLVKAYVTSLAMDNQKPQGAV